MANPLLLLQAAINLAQAAGKNASIAQERRGLRRFERQTVEDARASVENLRLAGDKFLAQKSINFLKNGVRLEGSPLLALTEDEKAIKAEIAALERRADAEARASRKARKRLRRSGRLALLTGGLAASVKATKAFGDNDASDS